MAITYAGALTYEATLGLKDETPGHFDPNYAPYALRTFPYESGQVYMTYTPIIPPNPTFDVWVQFKQVRIGNYGQVPGVNGATMFSIEDTEGREMCRIGSGANFTEVNLTLDGDGFNEGELVTGFFPQGYLMTYTFNLKQDGVNHTLKFYVNGILQSTKVRANTRLFNIGKVKFAGVFRTTDSPISYAISEMIMSDGEPLLGARLATLNPVGASSQNTWNGTWESLGDEDTGSGISTDQQGSRIAGNFSEYQGAPSPIGIRALVQSMRYVDNNSGLRVQGYLRKAGVNNDTFDQTTQDPSRVITVWDQNPFTNDDWKIEDLDEVDGGVRSSPYF